MRCRTPTEVGPHGPPVASSPLTLPSATASCREVPSMILAVDVAAAVDASTASGTGALVAEDLGVAATLPRGAPGTGLQRGGNVLESRKLKAILCYHFLRPRCSDRLYWHLHVERGAAVRVCSIAHAAAQDLGQLLRVVEAQAGALHRRGGRRGGAERLE
eukprot:6213601-Pleurochrysis_carterae.AAC.1